MASNAIDVARPIDVRPLAGNLGAEIFNIDLGRPLDDDTFAAINRALLEHLVIFFRDQAITPEQHIAFGRRFGDLHVHPYIPNLEGYAEIIKLQSADDGPGQMAYQSNCWHTDLTYTDLPPKASILRGVVIPEFGGDTMFLNLYAPYESLSKRMRNFVDGMTVVHNIVASMPDDFLDQSWAPEQLKRMSEATPPVEHPLVRTHPETGRKCLFVNRNFTARIKDLSRAESDALLNFLYAHIEQPEHQCRFRWQRNSIAMWDNRCTQHLALMDYRSLRVMHRVTVCGDRPF